MITVCRELRGGATQSPEALNLARERSGGKLVCRYGVPVTGLHLPVRRTPAGSPGGQMERSWTPAA